MKIQILILSVACLACLIPEAQSIGLLSILAGKALAAKGLALGAGILAAKKAALSIGAASIARTPVLTETEVVVEDTPVPNPAVVEKIEVQPIYGLRTEYLNQYAPAAPVLRTEFLNEYVPPTPVFRYEPIVEPVEVVEQVQVPRVYSEVRAVPQFQRLLTSRVATLTDIAANCLKNKITKIGDLLAALCGRHSVVVETYKK